MSTRWSERSAAPSRAYGPRVFGQATIFHLVEAEGMLQDAERMFDPSPAVRQLRADQAVPPRQTLVLQKHTHGIHADALS